jgi:hypothetical protein
MAGYPKIYNIEMDPHEDLQVGALFGWTAGHPLAVVEKYKETLKKYPNPLAGASDGALLKAPVKRNQGRHCLPRLIGHDAKRPLCRLMTQSGHHCPAVGDNNNRRSLHAQIGRNLLESVWFLIEKVTVPCRKDMRRLHAQSGRR